VRLCAPETVAVDGAAMVPGRCQRVLLLALVPMALLAASSGARAGGLRWSPLTIAALPAGGHDRGALPPASVVHASVALSPRHAAELAAYARAVVTPGASLYHRYLSVAQFAARFGLTAAQVARVRRALLVQGLAVGPISANRLTLPVTATAAVASRAFSTSFERFAMAGGATGYTHAATPTVSGAIAGLVQGVVGLQSVAPSASVIVHRARRSGSVRGQRPGATVTQRNALLAGSGPQPCADARNAGAGGAGYTADQIASAYGLSNYYAAGNQGRGVTIAVYELEPFSATDVAAYQACYGTSTSVTTIPVDGGAGRGYGSGEAAMDVQDLIGLAPQASIKVYEGPATGAGAYDTYSRIINDNSAQVIATAWGLCEALAGAVPAAAESTLFQEAAAQGQSVLAAAGDLGSNDCGDHRPAVDDPASQPWVTAVGATSRQASQDVVWNDSFGATGGGVSRLWGRPAYQAGAALAQSSVTCRSSGTACRELPDLSVHGDPANGYVAYFSGAWRIVGGTSIAAPTIAALTALADASPACGGHPLGFLNPALYRAAGNSYAANFTDVTSGTNAFGSVAGYAAGPGYDMASGLGTPAPGLGNTLCGAAVTLTAPSAQNSAAGRFASLQLSSSAAPGAAVSYSATGLPKGLTVQRTSGRISGTPRSVGRWTVTVIASNATGGAAQASFTWTVVKGSAAGAARQARAASRALGAHRVRSRGGRVGVQLHLRVTTGPAPGSRLAYTATGLPAGLGIDRHTGVISGRPRAPGSRTVRVRVSDRRGHSTTLTFRWTIRPA
jgi:subtilase family serine protease